MIADYSYTSLNYIERKNNLYTSIINAVIYWTYLGPAVIVGQFSGVQNSVKVP